MKACTVISWIGAALALVVLPAGIPGAMAASVASKNKEGNRMYEQKRYQEAEKAYLDAQLEAPERPELSYNLGNTLARQKKFDLAAQSLRQAVARGNKGLQASGWYNLGNTLFESGKYQDAAQAYIQSLRTNPADRDAKHNLELSWRKMQQQKQGSPGKNQKEDGQKSDSMQDRQEKREEQKNRQDQQQNQGSQNQREQKTAEPPQPSQAERKEGGMSRERALQILDAMKNQELMEKRKLLEQQARRKGSSKDW